MLQGYRRTARRGGLRRWACRPAPSIRCRLHGLNPIWLPNSGSITAHWASQYDCSQYPDPTPQINIGSWPTTPATTHAPGPARKVSPCARPSGQAIRSIDGIRWAGTQPGRGWPQLLADIRRNAACRLERG